LKISEHKELSELSFTVSFHKAQLSLTTASIARFLYEHRRFHV